MLTFDEQERLRDAQTQLQIVTECMAAPVTRCSRDFRYLWVSKRYADWIGRPADEIVGRLIVDVLGEEAFAQLLPRFERVLGGNKVEYEEQVNYRGLGLRWIQAIYTPTFDQDEAANGWVAVVLDVTQRRQIEAALRASEQRFAGFTQHLPGLAWIKDLQGRYVYANDAAMQVFGRPRERLYGKTDDEIFPARTAAQFKANDRQALATSAGVQVIETLKHADGIVHHSLVSKFPIPGPDGRPASVGGMAIDVTDRMRAEEVLAESERRFRQLAEALQAANRRKDEFLATLAHELRNPLAPIRNAAEVLRMGELSDGRLREARDIIDRQVTQMVRLIDDLLDVSRITQGKLQLRRERLDLAVVVRNAVEAARPLLDAQAHELTLALPREPIALYADPVRLAQVFANLLNNAAKYTDKGGHVWLTAERQAGEVVVSVRDTGIGILAEHLPKVFEMFSQVTPALERSQGGLGIGLALVRGLIELHQGAVEARSAGPGRGSEFIVRLPLAEELRPPIPESIDEGEKARGGGKRRILVADDLRDCVDSLAIMLRLAGHEIQTAHDGLEAVQAVAAFRPDVVLLDIGMPRMNGYEAARHIREQSWGKELVLVALTGWGQDDDKRRAAEAGFDHHLTKPVSLAALKKLLAALEQGR